EFTKELTKFAASTPFELKGLETASKQLLAYGFEQKQVLPNLKALGDIAAGVGMDKLPQLILAFGQVKAATRLTGNELRQFTEAG
uniref:tape measure protein n=1 Tax=Pseudomonas atacamensis TaxID=2565368 RepID=UPI002B1DFA00